MRHLALLGLISIAALTAAIAGAEAQNRRRATVIVEERAPPLLRVRPRSFLDAGTVAPVGSLERQRSGYWQTQSYLVMPPWHNMRDRFGEGTLPDPIHGPFVGARNPFGPIDYAAPAGLR